MPRAHASFFNIPAIAGIIALIVSPILVYSQFDSSFGIDGPEIIAEGLPPPPDASATAGPVLGEGAGESRSDSHFVSKSSRKRDHAALSRRTVPDHKVDFKAEHSCFAKDFNIRFDANGRATGRLDILASTSAKVSAPGKRGSLSVGSLPLGIDVRFVATNAYELSLPPGSDAADISIVRSEGAQEGSMTVSFMYENGAGSTAACQLNIIND